MQADLSRLHADTTFAILERKRLLDSAWVMCWVSLIGAAAVPWFLSVLPIDLGRAAWFVFVSALAYLLAAALTDRLTNQSAVAMAMRLMPLASIVLMGALWHLVGGIANPIFLLAFVLPVVISSSTTISRQGHVSAALSSVVVWVIALAESAQLRWYVLGGRPSLQSLIEPVAAVLPRRPEIFAEVGTSPAYQLTILVTFTVTQVLVAFLATPLSTLLRRLDTRIQTSHRMLNEVQGLFHAVLTAEPDPSVIVYADSLQVVQASDSFFKRMLLRPSAIVSRSLFDVVRFDRADVVGQALSQPSGVLPFCVYRVEGEPRIANLNFHRTDHQGAKYIYVGWQEVTDLYYLQSAFDAVDDPLVVVSADMRLQYANRGARELFGPVHFGMEVASLRRLATLFDQAAAPASEDDRGYVTFDGRPYEVHRLTAGTPDASLGGTVVWLHCVAKEAALFDQAVRDPLTGVYNRRYFDDALARHLEKSKAGRALACAYFDLDDFKPINDRLGHAAGDRALVAFVEIVKSQLRAVDVFARLGGDEFAVLFVGCDVEVAEAAINRIRTQLDIDGWQFEGSRHTLRFSAGLAACRADDDVSALLQRTDEALYAAKTAGKGQSATKP
jgi:diguanylate cyclase (GGDEF)-like protein